MSRQIIITLHTYKHTKALIDLLDTELSKGNLSVLKEIPINFTIELRDQTKMIWRKKYNGR